MLGLHLDNVARFVDCADCVADCVCAAEWGGALGAGAVCDPRGQHVSGQQAAARGLVEQQRPWIKDWPLSIENCFIEI